MTSLLSVANAVSALFRGQIPGDLSDLAFRMPENELDASRLDGLRLDAGLPGGRKCCQLGGSVTPLVNLDDLRGAHAYGTGSGPLYISNAEGIGHIYTARGGFVDIGHVRDYIDISRFLSRVIHHAPLAGGQEILATEGGVQLKLVVRPSSLPRPPAKCALAGAVLSYERAVWHEIASYFIEIEMGVSERYSSFSPEDNFSNALGCLVGFRAVLEPETPFDTAVDLHLMGAIQDLGAVDKTVTEDALDYVDGFWFTTEMTQQAPFGDALRRNMDAMGIVRPWLVTDTAVPNKAQVLADLRARLGRPSPAPIVIPDRTPEDAMISDIAYWEFIKTPGSPLDAILPPGPTLIRSGDLPAIVASLRAIVRGDYPNGDERG